MRPFTRMFSYFVFLKIQMESPFSFTEESQFYSLTKMKHLTSSISCVQTEARLVSVIVRSQCTKPLLVLFTVIPYTDINYYNTFSFQFSRFSFTRILSKTCYVTNSALLRYIVYLFKYLLCCHVGFFYL